MPRLPSGKFRTNLTLAAATHQWLKEHSVGERGMGELVDQIVMKERLGQTLEARVTVLERLIKPPQAEE
jgi:hypothetical protein